MDKLGDRLMVSMMYNVDMELAKKILQEDSPSSAMKRSCV